MGEAVKCRRCGCTGSARDFPTHNFIMFGEMGEYRALCPGCMEEFLRRWHTCWSQCAHAGCCRRVDRYGPSAIKIGPKLAVYQVCGDTMEAIQRWFFRQQGRGDVSF